MNLLVWSAVTGVAQLPDSVKMLNKKLLFYKRPATQIKPASIPSQLHTTPFVQPSLNVKSLPVNYYSQHIGFFCTQELKLEKTTKIPFRFRLGSLEYCDVMEGKHR